MLPLGVAPAIAAAAAAPAAAAPAATPPKATPSKVRRARRTAEPEGIVEPAAVSALQRMSAYLGTLTAFEVQSQTSRDLVTTDGQRLTLDGVVNYKVRRPDGFVIRVDTDASKRTFYYNGKSFTLFSPDLNFYATAPAPPTILATLDALYDKFGIALPLEDLFRWNDPSMERARSLKSGVSVGKSTIDGVATDQYAFREGDIDWQIWIQQGSEPLPRKVVIVNRTDPAYPTYIAQLTWNVTPTLTDNDFTFQPGPDAKPIRLSSVGQ
jgi:hypothetical protein